MKTLSALVLIFLATQCLASETFFPAKTEPARKLVIASNTDQSSITPLLRGFQVANPDIEIIYIEHNSNPLNEGALVSCEAGDFFADIVLSSSIAQQAKLVNDGCSLNIRDRENTVAMDNLPSWANWQDELVGLTFEAAAMVINKDAFRANWPQTHQDLISLLSADTGQKWRIGTYDIEQSGVGYIFAFYDQIYSSSSQRLFDQLGKVQAQLFCCSSQIIDAVADGNLDIGLNVLGSYAMYRAERDSRIHVQFPSDFAPVLTRAAFISKHSKNPSVARLFIGFSLSQEGQKILNGDARLLSSISGEDELQILTGTQGGNFRPISLDASLLIGVDQATSADFIESWQTHFKN